MTADNDVIALSMAQAAERFGGGDGTFNAAGFGICLMRIAGLEGGMDGHLVRAILCGRSDVTALRGGSHFRIVDPEAAR